MNIRPGRILSLVATATAAASLLVVAAASAAPARAAVKSASVAPVVKTENGAVSGLAVGPVREFMGIPYAAPPVGPLRWEAPQPHANWKGALSAIHPGNECAQLGFMGTAVHGSEDCLYLNIYTPNPPDKAMPVMVWIHGGSFLIGSGADYNGSRLAAKGHLIVVTINYRLGPLGFLANRNLDRPNHPSGNYGLLDQQAALRWVKDNIAAFGGDPAKVTIAGESAGGISVGLQMVSPAAAGLFARAIIESGPLLGARTLKQAEKTGDKFATELGCTKASAAAKCMRSKSVRQVLLALPASPIGRPVWGPVVDGRVIPETPGKAFAAGHFAKVPVIDGTNHDEGTLFLAFAKPLSESQYEANAKKSMGANAARMLAAYPLKSYASPQQAFAAIFGDRFFSCTVRKTNGVLGAQVPVYAYEFNDRNAPNQFGFHPPFPLGAYHSSEIQYVFGVQPKQAARFSPAQRKLSDAMMGYWIGFITSGDPGGNPRWTAYTSANDHILSFAPGKIAYESDFAKVHHCALWNSIPRP